MTIELITEEQYSRIIFLQKKFPNLTYQNKDYDTLQKSELSEEELLAFNEIENILKIHVKDFVKFNHFKLRKNGDIALRFQYHWSNMFTGVGYLKITELLNGFEGDLETDKEIENNLHKQN